MSNLISYVYHSLFKEETLPHVLCAYSRSPGPLNHLVCNRRTNMIMSNCINKQGSTGVFYRPNYNLNTKYTKVVF